MHDAPIASIPLADALEGCVLGTAVGDMLGLPSRTCRAIKSGDCCDCRWNSRCSSVAD